MEKLIDLFPSDQAEVTENGILFNGIIYSCSIAIRDQWYLQASYLSRKIPIFIDNYDDEYILLLLNDGSLTLAYRILENGGADELSNKNYQEVIRSLKRQLKNRTKRR
ncbi:hypothetical protein [Paenibacillus sp. FSL K6-2524]|uniref:hypothetical protein n=1 Tax=Paenibacillus sp. FSL K6-2524 TaxID=2954516 RepID=UPI0030FBE840